MSGPDLGVVGELPAFAGEHNLRIAAYWAERSAARPKLWNGEVLICTRHDVMDGILTARFAKTDYASFVVWRDSIVERRHIKTWPA